MARGGMSPRGGLSDVAAGADARWEDEPAPSTSTTDGASSGVRVTLADSTRAQVLRAFLREHRERRGSGETGPGSVDALLDSMEAARRETSSASLARAGAGPPARVSDDVFSFGSGAFGIRSGSAWSRGAPSAVNDAGDGGGDDDSFSTNGASGGARAFGIDARAAARWLEHTAPVCVILLVSFLFARLEALAAFAWTTAVFLRADASVRRAVSDASRSAESAASTASSASTPSTASTASTASIETATRASETTRDARPGPGGSAARAVPARASARRSGSADGGHDAARKGAFIWESRDGRRLARLVAACLLSGGAIGVLAVAFPAEPFWDALAFRPARHDAAAAANRRAATRDTRADSFLDHLWRAAMADVCLRLGTVCAKALALILAPRARRGRRRRDDAAVAAESRAVLAARLRRRAESRFLACIEATSLLVRTAMPVATWFAYFARGALGAGARVWFAPEEARRLGACFAAGAYLAVKLRATGERLVACRAAASAMLEAAADHTGLGAGARESDDAEIRAAGNECAVCHDAFEAPVTLACGHAFCARCVGAWFERSRACPLCRAVVAGKHCGVIEHGDGATTAWPYVF